MRRLFAVALAALCIVAAPADARRKPQPTPSPTLSPSPLPTPPSEAVRFAFLRRELAEISATAPGRLGIATVELGQFTRFTARADEAFPLASVANIAIALVAFRRADQHRLDLDRRIEITHGGATFTYAESLRAMVIDNDRKATGRVLRAIGGPKAVDAFLARSGLAGTHNGATPNAVANLLTGIANQQYLHLETNSELLALLGEVHAGRARLAAGFPANAAFAHESGSSATLVGKSEATNDAGILTLPDGRRVIVVAFLGESNADVLTREATLARVARAIYAAYVP